MNDYWKALINGLTPDKPGDANLMWKAPLILMVAFILIAMVFRGGMP